MRNIIILIFTLAALAFAGCNDYMEITPKGKVIPQSIEHYYELLSNSGVFQNGPANMFHASDDIVMYDDEMNRLFTRIVETENTYLFKDHIYINIDMPDMDWDNLYKQIYICNVVLDNIDNAPGENESLRSTVKGEALAQRAQAFFWLVNLYAKHYDSNTSTTDPGVPMPVKADVNATLERSTVKELYTLIENDLLEAENLLSTDLSYNYRPSQQGVHGLLAKMYLFMGKFEEALEYADKSLAEYSFLYDYKEYDFHPYMPKFMGPFMWPRLVKDDKEAVWGRTAAGFMPYTVAVYMSEDLKSLYSEGDRRFYFSVQEMSMFGPNNHGPSILPLALRHRSGIHTAELYLIRAECNARLDNPIAAINDLNTLRETRINADTFVPYETSLSSDEALELVLNERRVELFLDGQRLFDLKRLNKDPRFAKTISRTFNGQTYTIEPDDENYVLAIPKKVRNLNPNIEQNPRTGRN
uniref:RagB/SusD family nutrient uptake outer membrane protein n=1 Tax=uncultured Draconibacterium sp. TaxID=1573823 RepID=UPI0032170868